MKDEAKDVKSNGTASDPPRERAAQRMQDEAEAGERRTAESTQTESVARSLEHEQIGARPVALVEDSGARIGIASAVLSQLGAT